MTALFQSGSHRPMPVWSGMRPHDEARATGVDRDGRAVLKVVPFFNSRNKPLFVSRSCLDPSVMLGAGVSHQPLQLQHHEATGDVGHGAVAQRRDIVDVLGPRCQHRQQPPLVVIQR